MADERAHGDAVTRDDASEWLSVAAWAMCGGGRSGIYVGAWERYAPVCTLYNPGQSDELRWAAEQLHERGPVWMRRQARIFAAKARGAFRPDTGGYVSRHPMSFNPNVRAYWFAAAVLRELANAVATTPEAPR